MGCGSTKSSAYLSVDSHAKLIEGETITHVNSSYPDTAKYVKECEYDTTIGEIQKSMLKFADKPCLGYRKMKNENDAEDKYTWFKFSEISKLSEKISKSIFLNNLYEEKTFEDQEGKWKIVGIFARNCVEWVVTDLACQMNDVTSVTFYATLGAESFDHIFSQTEVSTVFVSPENISKLAEYHKKYNFKSLKNVVIFDFTLDLTANNKDIAALENLNLKILYFSNLVKDEIKEEVKLTPARPDSYLTLCYTSGTTSLPKGAMLTQRGFISQKCFNEDANLHLNENDVVLSYLPMAHVLERLNVFIMMASGVRLGFITGLDIKKWLMEDLPILKPTVFVTVPRILVNFHQKVMDTFGKLTGCKKSTADSGIKTKRENYEKNLEIKHWYYDALVFGKIRDKFGGKVRCIITGSAPLPRDISRDIKLLLSCPIIEGYGMTELHGASNATSYNDYTNSNVGGILRTLKLKLVDNKALNYHSKTEFEGREAPTGEICFYGPSVFKGYFRDAENTKSTIDSDGWLHTGDVGMIDPFNKGLKIVDRVKEIFKLSQGEYIAPAKLEGMYIKSPFVAQICIYGNSEKSYIIAIVVVNKGNVAHTLQELGIIQNDKDDITSHLENEKLVAAVKASFDDIAKQCKFSSLEKPLKFILTTDEFTIQNDLLTPTMKLVRKKIQIHFQKQIDQIYTSN